MDLKQPWLLLLYLSMILFSYAGFAFVYFEDERDAEDAIRGLDNMPFGHDRRRLSVEWAKVIPHPLPSSLHLVSQSSEASGLL